MQLSNGLTDAELHWKDAAGGFSVLENICHLRDIEIEGYTVRIDRILNQSQPFLPDIDGSRLASEREYNQQNPEKARRAFVEARTRNIQELRGVGFEQIARTGTLEGVGPISLGKLLLIMSEHDESHIHDLRAIRKRLDAQVTEFG